MQVKMEKNGIPLPAPAPKPTKFVTLMYKKDGTLMARKEFDGTPAQFMPLPVPKADNRVMFKCGLVFSPVQIHIYKLLEVRKTPGLDFDEAIYIEHEVREPSMEGVTILDRRYESAAEILRVFDELNNPGFNEKVDVKAVELALDRKIIYADLNEHEQGKWRIHARQQLELDQNKSKPSGQKPENADDGEKVGPTANAANDPTEKEEIAKSH